MKKQSKYRYALPLQLFADGDGGAEGGAAEGQQGAEGGQGEAGNGGEGNKTFTQEDVDKIISTRLGKEKSKMEKEFQAEVEKARTEAEKLAKMNADQKAQYEQQKKQDELTTREGEITRRELRATALETLAEKGLPRQLAEILSYTDADSTNASIEAVEKAFREAVEVGVNERLKGKTPGTGSVTGQKPGDFGKQLAEQATKGNKELEEAKKTYFN